jgi:Zn-dependent protease
MPGQIRLGRIAGVVVAVHWSVLAIVALFSWSLATVSLPSAAPGYADWAYWLVGVGAAVLLIGSLAAHEMAHALVARRAGIPVEDLTLWLFGGVTRLGGESPSAEADFRVAIVGPMTSIGLAAVCAAVAGALTGLGVSSLPVTGLWWLALTNGILGVFNLLPGAPLDGGRVLRAYLWHRHGDRLRATASAARAGEAVGIGLAVLGVLELVGGAAVGGLWLMFLGWFLVSAARTEQDDAGMRQVLAGVRVADVMTPDPETAASWLTIEDFVERHVLGRHHSAYPVLGFNGDVEGLVTLAQLRSVPPAGRATTRIGQVAIPIDRTPTATPDEPLLPLLQRMAPAAGGRALVFDRGLLVGIVTPADVSKTVELRMLAGLATTGRPQASAASPKPLAPPAVRDGSG